MPRCNLDFVDSVCNGERPVVLKQPEVIEWMPAQEPYPTEVSRAWNTIKPETGHNVMTTCKINTQSRSLLIHSVCWQWVFFSFIGIWMSCWRGFMLTKSNPTNLYNDWARTLVIGTSTARLRFYITAAISCRRIGWVEADYCIITDYNWYRLSNMPLNRPNQYSSKMELS